MCYISETVVLDCGKEKRNKIRALELIIIKCIIYIVYKKANRER